MCLVHSSPVNPAAASRILGFRHIVVAVATTASCAPRSSLLRRFFRPRTSPAPLALIHNLRPFGHTLSRSLRCARPAPGRPQETERLVADPAPGIQAVPHEDNLRYFDVVMDGPGNSPFEGEWPGERPSEARA